MIIRDARTGIERTRRSTAPCDQHTIAKWNGWTFFYALTMQRRARMGSVVGPARVAFSTLQCLSGCRQGSNIPTDTGNRSGILPYYASFLTLTLGDDSEHI
jgi:hypothetical protein